jgi:hypothetical protein
MNRTIRIEQLFRGADDGVSVRRYEVHAPVVRKKGDDCVTTANLARAERALVFRAMSEGMRSPSALRYAREALEMDVSATAAQTMESPFAVVAWESGALPISDEAAADLTALLEQSDRGGMLARRCL